MIDWRVGDISAVYSSAKSWLYADLLEKPEELAQWRRIDEGGLGLFNIAVRAKAYHINTFMETASKPSFQHSLFHETLYKQEVMEEGCGVVKLLVPPYFSGDFFPAIKRMKSSGLSLPGITLKAIYKFLLGEILMTETEELIPLKVEAAMPALNWKKTWSMVRQRGLSPEIASFIFKLLHRILP